jgi:excisionase family DNA binding protein
VEKQTIYRLIKTGKLKAFQLGTSYRVKDEALQEFCKEIEVE